MQSKGCGCLFHLILNTFRGLTHHDPSLVYLFLVNYSLKSWQSGNKENNRSDTEQKLI